MAYYSLYKVICYKEVIYLGLFGSFYIATSGLNVMMIVNLYDEDDDLEYPFAYYYWGAFVGLLLIIFLSDCIFQ